MELQNMQIQNDCHSETFDENKRSPNRNQRILSEISSNDFALSMESGGLIQSLSNNALKEVSEIKSTSDIKSYKAFSPKSN